MSLATVSYARIEWQSDGTPYNQDYGDVYFSRVGGLAESRHVYLYANQLPERWQKHFLSHRFFVIAEAGFGTGLNFLLTATSFLQHQVDAGELWYYAIEKSPISPADLQRALQAFPEFTQLATSLLQHYPRRLKGWHHLHFRRIHLVLIFEDIVTALTQLRESNARMDAWYLDAFAPAVNADMWTDSVLFSIGKLSRSDATASTYSAAGAIRRGLDKAGFDVEKRPGFGQKREMTFARLRERRPRYETANLAGERGVKIVGAGIAGCALAYELACAGVDVTVHEKANIGGVLATHPAAIACPRWTRNHALDTQWQVTGLLRLQQLLQQADFSDAVLYRGLFEHNEFTPEDFHRLGLDNELIVRRDQGWWQTLGVTVNPLRLCQALLRHPRINVITKHYEDNDDNLLVFCDGAAATARWPQLPLIPVRGQMTVLDCALSTATPVTRDQQYRIHLHDRRWLIGSTFERDTLSDEVTETSHQQNWANLLARHPQLAQAPHQIVQGLAGIRLGTRDHMPLVGAFSDQHFCSIAHGSHGLMSAFAAAKKLLTLLTGTPQIMPTPLLRRTDCHRWD